MRSVEHTPAELVVAEVILSIREDEEINAMLEHRSTRAIKPFVQARTGASNDLYWRACRIANAQ